MPVEPVPMTPTRRPATSTPSCGQCAGVVATRPRTSRARGCRARSRRTGSRAADHEQPARRPRRRRSVVDAPAAGVLVEGARRRPACRSVMSRAQVEPVGDVVEVAQDLGLARGSARSSPTPAPARRRRSRSSSSSRVAAGARVAVPVPGAADAVAASSTRRREPEPAQPVQRVQPGEPGADDDDVRVRHGCPPFVGGPTLTRGARRPRGQAAARFSAWKRSSSAPRRQ